MNLFESFLTNSSLDQVLKIAPTATKPVNQYLPPPPACDEKEFLRCVERHQMKIRRDDGVHRHIRFSNPNDCNQWFELLTWPGNICFSGDMGTFVFQRIEDMFRFFRADKNSTSIRINPSYWAQKCEASDRDGIEKFNPDTFKARVSDWLNDLEDGDSIRDEVEDQIMDRADDGEYPAINAAIEFTDNDGHQPFQDFYEVNCREYTYCFLWCCYAIVWGIRQYDQARSRMISERVQAMNGWAKQAV